MNSVERARKSKQQALNNWSRGYLQGRYDQSWKEAHPELVNHVPTARAYPQGAHTNDKRVVVVCGRNKSSALWNRKLGVWSCTEADHGLEWMIGMTPHQVNVQLEATPGVHHHWEKIVKTPHSDLLSDADLEPQSSHTEQQLLHGVTPRPGPDLAKAPSMAD